MKHNTPLNLKKFTVESAHSIAEVRRKLLDLSFLMRENQGEYYADHYEDFVKELITNEVTITGSLNSFGQKLGLKAPVEPAYQPYNFNDMFRANILAKTTRYIQDTCLVEFLLDNDYLVNEQKQLHDVKNTIAAFKADYPFAKVPTTEYLKQVTHQVFVLGNYHSTPAADGVLPLWATDMHYCKKPAVMREGHDTVLKLSLKLFKDEKYTTLVFKTPKKTRFELQDQKDKYTRPTIFTRNGELMFGFVLQKTIEPAATNPNTYLGVDLGKTTPFVATVRYDEARISAPILPSRTINILDQKVKNHTVLMSRLFAKRSLCEANGHVTKALVLKIEYQRVKQKRTRLKRERALRAASLLISKALETGAVVLLENLAWVPDSRWDQSAQQTAIVQKAQSVGVAVRKISPKNTSRECSNCGGLDTMYRGRTLVCRNADCGKELDRDVSASRVLTNRQFREALKKKRERCALRGNVLKQVCMSSDATALARDNHNPGFTSVTDESRPFVVGLVGY